MLKSKSGKIMSGISVLIHINGKFELNKLLEKLFKFNTLQTYEILIVDSEGKNNISECIQKFVTQAFIRHVKGPVATDPEKKAKYSSIINIYGMEDVEKLTQTFKKDNTSTKDFALDVITKLLLSNSGKIKLSEYEKKQALECYDSLTNKRSEPLSVNQVNQIPDEWSESLKLAPLPEGPNDYEWYLKYCYQHKQPTRRDKKENGLSIVVPTFNRSHLLEITLACLVNQKTDYSFEVIIADDGSKESLSSVVKKYESKLDIKYVRQKDYGYQLCAVRNLGLRTTKYEFVSILDCDMAPGVDWVQSYMEELLKSDDIALIGPRKYVDTYDIDPEQILSNNNIIYNLPEVKTNSDIGNTKKNDTSVDWRLEHFAKTDNLRLCDSPFRFFSCGNVAFSKKWLRIVGWFDEEFTHWGGEDNEFGYRLFRAGCFFKVVHGCLAYHQEPPGRENETDRAAGKAITSKIVQEKVPYFYRKIESIQDAMIHRVPLVSIYIPAYNCEDYIKCCVNSALNQTVTDLEVCICDAGSTDSTYNVLKENYAEHPRVRFISTTNGGIGVASNNAVKLCRGYYIGQLDSDDYLEPDAVEKCLNEFIKDRSLVCVYTANRNVNPDGSLINNGFNWPQFSREKLTCTMICHHFRMFTIRAWNLTEGFDETSQNAVDYDIYLKLSEIGVFKHVNCISYNRTIHDTNTSVIKTEQQKINHFNVVNKSLERQDVTNFSIKPVNNTSYRSRAFYIQQKPSTELNEYFDKVYLVNMPSEKEKQYSSIKQLNDLNIEFKLFEAVDGYSGDALKKYNEYISLPLGSLTRYPEYNEREVWRGKKFIESAGAIGYIYTYLEILKEAKKKAYKKIFIIEDDVILPEDFHAKFRNFINKVGDNWKVLMFGASQYGWDSVDDKKAIQQGYYFPRQLDTCGSYAIAINCSIIDELIEAESAFEGPFDHLPLGEIYEKYLGQCFVSYPNIVMPDVSNSTIRASRSQYEHAKKMKWPVNDFKFPRPRVSLSVIVTSKKNVKYLNKYNEISRLPFELRIYYYSNDGLRPVHNPEVVPDDYFVDETSLNYLKVPNANYYTTLSTDAVLTEEDCSEFIDYALGISGNKKTNLVPIDFIPKPMIKERVSVIIPTYGRPDHLRDAINSVVIQDYSDIEIIIVDDNNPETQEAEKTGNLVEYIKNKSRRHIKYIQHSDNRNGAAARNTGILASTGEYICFLDDDDVYLQGRVSKTIAAFQKCNSNVDGIYCGFIGWNAKKDQNDRYKTGDLTQELLLLEYEKHFLHTNTITFKKSALLAINGFDETYVRHQDIELFLRYFRRHKVECIKEQLVEIKPKPVQNNNMLFNEKILYLKEKFFKDFSHIVNNYQIDVKRNIYIKHYKEVCRYCKDKNEVKNYLTYKLDKNVINTWIACELLD